MKNKRQIISAIAAASVLSITTGVSAFASNQAAKNEKKAEEAVTVTEEVTAAVEEETAAPETEEAATEEAAAEEAAEEATEVTAEEAEKPAEEAVKPLKPTGPKEIKDKIAEIFDFDNENFKDDESKNDWFDFCNNDLKIKEHMNKPEPPAPPVKPADDETKPEPPAPPVKPADDEAKPEPPAPPVKPADDEAKPEPPKPHTHEHINPIKEAAVENTTSEAVETEAAAE